MRWEPPSGIGVAFTPFVGLHIVLACAIAWSFGGNLIAGAIGTAVGNPVTYPFIWAGTYEVGQFLLQDTSRDAPGAWGRVIDAPIEQILPLIKPMLLGSIPLGIAAGCIGFIRYHIKRLLDIRRRGESGSRSGREA